MAKLASLVLGAVFVLVGILGWIPNPIVGEEGMFVTNMLHDLVHLITGILFIVIGLVATNQVPMVFKVFGVVYLLVAVLGFMQGDSILGLITTNTADHYLHVVLGLVILGLGFMIKGDGNRAMGAPMATPPMNTGTPGTV